MRTDCFAIIESNCMDCTSFVPCKQNRISSGEFLDNILHSKRQIHTLSPIDSWSGAMKKTDELQWNYQVRSSCPELQGQIYKTWKKTQQWRICSWQKFAKLAWKLLCIYFKKCIIYVNALMHIGCKGFSSIFMLNKSNILQLLTSFKLFTELDFS